MATIALAVAAAAAAASTAMQVSANARASKLQNKALQQQYAANADQQLQLEMQKVLAKQNHSVVASQLGDQAVQNGLNRSALALAGRGLDGRAALLRVQSDRLRGDAAVLGDQAALAGRGLDLKRDEAVAASVDAGAQTMAKAAKDLAAVRALAGEAGLAGSSMVAFAREIAHVEGTNLAAAARETRGALEGVAAEGRQTLLRATSALNDLGRRADALVSEGQQVQAERARAALTGVSLDIADRQTARDQLRNDINLDGAEVGISAQASQLESAAQVAHIQGQLSNLQMSTQSAQSIFSMIGSGAQLAGSYYSGAAKLEAQRKQYQTIQGLAKNKG